MFTVDKTLTHFLLVTLFFPFKKQRIIARWLPWLPAPSFERASPKFDHCFISFSLSHDLATVAGDLCVWTTWVRLTAGVVPTSYEPLAWQDASNMERVTWSAHPGYCDTIRLVGCGFVGNRVRVADSAAGIQNGDCWCYSTYNATVLASSMGLCGLSHICKSSVDISCILKVFPSTQCFWD